MSVSGVSAYSQIESWRAKQKAFTDSLLGSNSSAGSADFSSAFTSVSAGFYSGLANVASVSALSRLQNDVNVAQGNDTDGGTLSRSVGNAILTQLGYPSTLPANTSSSGTYSAPVNSATGHGYVKASAASINSLNALNLFA
jgi:hypothetical protein